jgi:hypothetical protein
MCLVGITNASLEGTRCLSWNAWNRTRSGRGRPVWLDCLNFTVCDPSRHVVVQYACAKERRVTSESDETGLQGAEAAGGPFGIMDANGCRGDVSTT